MDGFTAFPTRPYFCPREPPHPIPFMNFPG
jgi:hypothetical protein